MSPQVTINDQPIDLHEFFLASGLMVADSDRQQSIDDPAFHPLMSDIDLDADYLDVFHNCAENHFTVGLWGDFGHGSAFRSLTDLAGKPLVFDSRLNVLRYVYQAGWSRAVNFCVLDF